MNDVAPDSWLLVQLSTRTLWLPRRRAGDVIMFVTGLRDVGPSETEWDADALVPVDDLHEIRVPVDGAPIAGASFRIDRDVALVGPSYAHAALPPEEQLARFGPVDMCFGQQWDDPGVPTLTTNQHRRRLGLHVDNWDRLPAGRRHRSRNRANLNLGPELRTFLFADLDITLSVPDDEVPDTAWARRWVRGMTPPPPIIGIDIPPGWGYIAPTENVLHDGSSQQQRSGTEHVSGLGHFTPTHGAGSYDAVGVAIDLPTVEAG